VGEIPHASAECLWCGTPYNPHDLPAWEDFGASPGYCSTACESAHGEFLLRRLKREAELALRTYQQQHMLDPDWRAHLTPVGDADRCRHCTGVFFAPVDTTSEFCSEECEREFRDAQSRYDDTRDRESDTTMTAA
jgi:hypothetical protein